MCDDIFSSTEPEKLVLKIQEASSVETNCTMFLSWHCWREKFHEKEKQNKQRMKNEEPRTRTCIRFLSSPRQKWVSFSSLQKVLLFLLHVIFSFPNYVVEARWKVFIELHTRNTDNKSKRETTSAKVAITNQRWWHFLEVGFCGWWKNIKIGEFLYHNEHHK